MKWLVVTPFSFTSEVGWVPAEVSDSAHAFEVITTTYSHDRSRKFSSSRQWLDYLYHAIRALRSARPSSRRTGIITSFPQLAAATGLIKRLMRLSTPILAWSFNLGAPYAGIRGILARYALSKVDIFVVHSVREIDTYSKWLDIPPERFVFVPLAVEFAREINDLLVHDYVLSMGTAGRDYKTLFAAVERLDYPTTIVSGSHAVAEMNIPSNVQIRSGLPLAACHDLCRRARVNVVPLQNGEVATGQVTILETMMYGKAVVATRSPGTENYIHHGVTGLLVPPNDAAALQQAVKYLWEDEDECQRLGDAARQFVREHCSFGAVAPRMRELLDLLEKNYQSQFKSKAIISK